MSIIYGSFYIALSWAFSEPPDRRRSRMCPFWTWPMMPWKLWWPAGLRKVASGGSGRFWVQKWYPHSWLVKWKIPLKFGWWLEVSIGIPISGNPHIYYGIADISINYHHQQNLGENTHSHPPHISPKVWITRFPGGKFDDVVHIISRFPRYFRMPWPHFFQVLGTSSGTVPRRRWNFLAWCLST